MDPQLVRELILDYNNNPDRYNDSEAEIIATLANTLDTNFRREDKSMQKGLFSLINTASFGLLPDDMRPQSRGESVYGDTDMEKLFSGIGTLGGALGGGYGAYKVAGKAVRAGRGIAKNAYDRIRNRFGWGPKGPGSGPSTTYSPDRINDPSKLLEGDIAGGGNLRLSGYGRTGKGMRFPISQASGKPIGMGSGQKLLQGRSGMELPPANFLDHASDYFDQRMAAHLREIYRRYGIGV